MDETLFPHKRKRDIQDIFLQDVVRNLNNQDHFLIHAPTGMGKTTILGPALFHALKKRKTVFFLTPMHTQHKIAIKTLELIKKKHNMDFVAVDFIGKKWMCQQPGVQAMGSSEFSEYCVDLTEKKNCKYFNNLKKKGKVSAEAQEVLKNLKEMNPLDNEKLCKICGKAKLCPYEISCMLAYKANVIICDYFHVLSPGIRGHFLKKINKDLGKSILIFDEAHNLPSKTRDLLTSNLSTFTILYALRECKRFGYDDAHDKIIKIKEILERFVKEKTDINRDEALILKDEFVEEINQIENYKDLALELNMIGSQVMEQQNKSATKSIGRFLDSWKGKDEGFARILTKGFGRNGKTFITLSYRCLDPSMILKPISDEALIIGMSGTLTPIQMYKDLFGYESETKEYDDPFPKKNRLNLIVPKTTTKYSQRDPEMWQKIAVVTSKLVNSVPGNSAVFFPSYYIRDQVNNYFQSMCEKTTFIEDSRMNKEERAEMLEKYKKYKADGAVLLGCSAGSFGEGIDLKGDYLKAVVVVGLPLAKPDLETKQLIEYYDKRFGKGWDYGYVFPAMIKTVQNAGRCIRSKKDKGVIVFLDERYVWQGYSKCFPKDWQIKTTRMPIKPIEEFFKS